MYIWAAPGLGLLSNKLFMLGIVIYHSDIKHISIYT